MTATDFTGLAGLAFAITTSILAWPNLARRSLAVRLGLATILLIALLIPFGDLSLTKFLRGIVGDLSISTLALLARTLQKPSAPIKTSALLLIAISGLVLYIFALGFSTFDFYRSGFGNYYLISSLFAVTLLAWWRQNFVLLSCLSLASLAWSVGYYESTNLWNYLLDPLLVIYAISALIHRLLTRKKTI